MNKGVPISDLPIVAEIPDGSLLPAVVEGTTSAVEIETLRARVQTDLSDYYTKAETNELVSKIPKFAIEVVDTLPTDNISNTTVYLVKSSAEVSNLYTEYIYVNGNWEELGEQTVDLSNYYTKQETDAAIESQVDGAKAELETEIADLSDAVSDLEAVKLYNEYGTNTDGAVTQNFISEKLNGSGVSIGDGASISATFDKQKEAVVLGKGALARAGNGYNRAVIIGRNAKANTYGSSGSVDQYGIAIGDGATVAPSNSNAKNSYGIAIGAYTNTYHVTSASIGHNSYTTREYEFSIGNKNNGVTRYLANVTAGELDTDAVNKKQMEDYVAENAPTIQFPDMQEFKWDSAPNIDETIAQTIWSYEPNPEKKFVLLVIALQGTLTGDEGAEVEYTFALKQGSSFIQPRKVITTKITNAGGTSWYLDSLCALFPSSGGKIDLRAWASDEVYGVVNTIDIERSAVRWVEV